MDEEQLRKLKEKYHDLMATTTRLMRDSMLETHDDEHLIVKGILLEYQRLLL